ncbi:MAG: hypothetical protein GTO63_10035 [Anaerolineae bacterium]|nr:hypothetical protein [Anaerolineae bacterium]NIQ78124.1 hypothetical protein [Anaerolineae bacterium]
MSEFESDLRRWCPELADVIDQLDEWHREYLGLAFPVGGSRPYFGIEMKGSIVKPSDPTMQDLFKRMDDLLWEHAREHCEQVMAIAQDNSQLAWMQMVHRETLREEQSPRNARPDPSWPTWIDGEAHEILPEERRLNA